MTENILARLFEHNHWANLQLIQACSALSDVQLDAEPQSAAKGSIRLTLWHIMDGQQTFLSQLIGMEPRINGQAPASFAELLESAIISGEGLLALARDEASPSLKTKIQDDGYSIEPWVVMVQTINHATEHREQIKNMLSALGVTPPILDGGAYGRVANAVIPIST
ncbi:MAG TPA: DinB family protein [Anaerolineales bacterium]|nr:DinB family protein [Anaerolineales bacterium]